jgi:hypothetical protein
MKYKILVLRYLLLLIPFVSFSQPNLVSNSSFEQGLDGWLTNGLTNLFSPVTLGSYDLCITASDGQGYIDVIQPIPTDVPSNYFGNQVPFSGNNYAGVVSHHYYCHGEHGHFSSYLGVELNEPLIKGMCYILKFKIANMTENVDKSSDIKIALAKNINSDNTPDEIIKEKEFKNSSINDAGNGWSTYYFEYTPEDNGIKYLFFIADKNWGYYTNHAQGYYIDDVLVIDKCSYNSFNCSPVAGQIIAHFPTLGFHNANSPWRIENLQNVINADIVIYPALQNTPIKEYHIKSYNGISYPIYWDGKNNNGSEVAAGQYSVYIKLTNHCFEEKWDDENFYIITKLNASSAEDGTMPVPVHTYEAEGNEIPIPNCTPYIYVSKTFPYSTTQPYVYNATDILWAGDEAIINPSSEVNFYAGNHIMLMSGFSAKKGSTFHAIITQNTLKTASDSANNLKDTSGNFTQQDNQRLFVLFPNPNNGNMTINYELSEKETVTFEVYDMMGKKILSYSLIGSVNTFYISHTDLEQGIYVYRAFESNKQIASDKIVIIK